MTYRSRTNDISMAQALDLGPYFGGLEATLYASSNVIDGWLIARRLLRLPLRRLEQVCIRQRRPTTIRLQRSMQRSSQHFGPCSTSRPSMGAQTTAGRPYLSTWNALLNQPFATLYDMLRSEGETSQQLQQLVIDQTPILQSAMIGFFASRSRRGCRLARNVTMVNLTQTIPRTGLNPSLLATLPAGNEYSLFGATHR